MRWGRVPCVLRKRSSLWFKGVICQDSDVPLKKRRGLGNNRNMDDRTHDIAMVPVHGEISVRNAAQLRATLDTLMGEGTKRIILNMADVPYMDSAGMGVIIGCLRRMRCQSGLLSLVNVSPDVLRALKIARIVDLCPVSLMGTHHEVRELNPSALPLWRYTIPVDKDHLANVRGRIEELAENVCMSSDAVFDITLAAGEALGNACDHTSGEGVLATVSAYPDRIVVEVTDCGEGISMDEVEWRETSCDAERGRGIKLMSLLVDRVSISERPSGSGTVVRLTKMV